MLVVREHLRHATLEECTAAEQIAKDATMTIEQRNFEDTTGQTEGDPEVPTIRAPTPEAGELVYERRDRDVNNFVLGGTGGPPSETVTRRGVFDLNTGYRVEARKVLGIPSGLILGPLPAGVRNTFNRLYYRQTGLVD